MSFLLLVIRREDLVFFLFVVVVVREEYLIVVVVGQEDLIFFIFVVFAVRPSDLPAFRSASVDRRGSNQLSPLSVQDHDHGTRDPRLHPRHLPVREERHHPLHYQDVQVVGI